ncbi:hypothetical protein M8013_13655 [Enterobacteriaceae bacterium H4N4]|uniref:Uncharacterized protein n=1 Tax=Silvania confinis TaxID=2926470 RepID=A0A9J6QKB9_9ENTR|nr:hypothetical protein [Silvania confinis]MCU6669790.1 hypothetical protein [Silvania confinis]
MKYPLSLLMMLTFSFSVNSECRLIASQQSVSYGSVSAAERQAAGSKPVELPEKYLQFNVNCDEPQRVRLLFNSTLTHSNTFAFGSQGQMTFTAMKATVDEREVQLAPVRSADSVLSSSGSPLALIILNEGIAFVSGNEVRGKHISLTVAVGARFRNEAITEKMTYRGNLHVKVDAQ